MVSPAALVARSLLALRFFFPFILKKKCRAQASDVAPPRSASVDFDATAPRPNERVDPSMLLVASRAGMQSRAALREKARRFSKCTDTLTPEMVEEIRQCVCDSSCLPLSGVGTPLPPWQFL
jgi:hypothetical protein